MPADLSLYTFADQEWRQEASCRGADVDLFFPDRGKPGEAVRDMCFQCPVRLDCLDYSVETMQPAGWFGGHPLQGRRKIRWLLNTYEDMDLERADAMVLADSLRRMDRKRNKGIRVA